MPEGLSSAALKRTPAIGLEAQVDQLLLQFLKGRSLQGAGHLFHQQVGEHFAGALEDFAEVGLGERLGRLQLRRQLFGLSPGRVSQLRRDFMEDWRRFIGEAAG